MSALITELEVATANTNVRSGQIKNNSWLVDSGGGMFMSPDVTDAYCRDRCVYYAAAQLKSDLANYAPQLK